jgi:hypothetical protein
MMRSSIDVSSDGGTASTTAENHTAWKNLVRWVQEDHGGHVHSALHLQGGGMKPRGVVATSAVSKGEWLLRLPPSAIVSGVSISSIAKDEHEVSSVTASSWLKCVAALYQASQSKNWKPYLDSLPTQEEYETLFHWTDDQVKDFLAGTTLGAMVEADRKEDTLRKRYQLAVRPFLTKLGLVPPQEQTEKKLEEAKGVDGTSIEEIPTTYEELDTFLQACMCISTRGFHLTAGPDDDSYQGPFLLPIVDLLNHDPERKCTTLQRDETTGMFCMQAERDIALGEEIFHSYGDTLTAAQVLQTFGFVPPRTCTTETGNLTPVVLNKTTHILAACEHVKTSSIPKEIQDHMTSQSLINEDDEVWDVASMPNRPLREEDARDDWLISLDSSPTEILSDELITLVVLQFLPQDAYDEMIDADGRISAWLDRSILEDVYLGKLVCHTILEVIRRRQAEYLHLDGVKVDPTIKNASTGRPLERDERLLVELARVALPDISTLRAIYGLRVRIEELLSLEALAKEVIQLFDYQENGKTTEVMVPPASKRPKLEPHSE